MCSNKMVSAKSKSKMPQKTKTKCHKKQKQIATKNKNKMPQKTKIIWQFHLFYLSSREIEDGASHLVKLRDLIREYNKKEKQVPLREPDLMIVVTGGKMAYTRPDGVKIIPLACFKD